MGLEMDSDESSTVDLSPNTVLPSYHRCPKIEKDANGKSTRKDDILRVREGFTEISFRRYRSSSCRSVPSRPVGLEGKTELRRGSVYQSSTEVRKMKKMGTIEERRKIEVSQNSETSFPFRIVESLCSSDEENSQKRSPIHSLNSTTSLTSISKPFAEPCLLDSFIEIYPNLSPRDQQSAETVQRGAIKDQQNFRCDEVVGPLNDGNELLEKDAILTLHKSQSAKVELPYSPSLSENDHSSRTSSRIRFSPIKRMFDPFMKSKSMRSPLGYVVEHGEAKTIGNIRRNQTSQKSLLNDFSHTVHNTGSDSRFIKKDNNHSAVANSPVHLHGRLKLENERGAPLFRFLVDCPDDVFEAKMWKADKAFTCVYTFHDIGSRKKSNASGWGSNDSSKESSMVGQMQVSCHLSSELKKDGALFDNSMITEFVLYDIAQARQISLAQESTKCSPNAVFVVGNSEAEKGSDMLKPRQQPKHCSETGDFDCSNGSIVYPWRSANLHPNLEIAAVVIQVPFEKRESLKYRRGDKVSDRKQSNLLNLSLIEQGRKDCAECKSAESVRVIVPAGNHGLPSTESHGPSSILERWRLDEGCDCGGWDMGCPLTIFGNPLVQYAEDQPFISSQQHFELFLQGAKEKMPALTMRIVEEGQYAVDFHAQFSTLQAFSICVAILHGTEGSSAAAKQERSIQMTQCNSLKMLIKEEMEFLIGAASEGKKRSSKTVEEIPQSYVLNPPFSPIGRV